MSWVSFLKRNYLETVDFFQSRVGRFNFISCWLATSNMTVFSIRSRPRTNTMTVGIQGSFSPFPPGCPKVGPPTLQVPSNKTQRESIFLERPSQPKCQFYIKTMTTNLSWNVHTIIVRRGSFPHQIVSSILLVCLFHLFLPFCSALFLLYGIGSMPFTWSFFDVDNV